jgi:hypothetical protein
MQGVKLMGYGSEWYAATGGASKGPAGAVAPPWLQKNSEDYMHSASDNKDLD